MTDLPHRHWTENEELLEQYLLGRVDFGRRNELESHLRSCPECRSRVEAEEALVAGVRRLGREQLRDRLASRTRLIHPRQLSWQQFAAAAAVFSIALSIGVYQWWLTTQKREQTPAPSAAVTESSRPESAASQNQATDAVAYAAKEPAVGTEAREKGTTNYRTEADQSSPVRRDIPKNPELASTAAESLENAEKSSTTRSLWVDGTILPGESTAQDAANEVSSAKTNEKEPVGKLMLKKKEGIRHLQSDSHLAKDDQLFSLHQRLFSTLPAIRQQLSSKPLGRRKPAQIDRVGDSLSLTMYLDTLYDEATWASARIRMIGTDSLTIDLPGQRIGYKLPPGWNTVNSGVSPRGK